MTRSNEDISRDEYLDALMASIGGLPLRFLVPVRAALEATWNVSAAKVRHEMRSELDLLRAEVDHLQGELWSRDD